MVQILPDQIIYDDGTSHTGSEIDQVYASPLTSLEYIDTDPAGILVNPGLKINNGGIHIPTKNYAITSRNDTIFASDVFTESGSWVVPAGVTRAYVIVVGGGGGGGAVSTTPVLADGSGGVTTGQDIGGAGGLAFGMVAVTPGASITVTVGAGGTGSDTVAAGGNGGTSSFSTISATGGQGIGAGTGADGVGSGGTSNGDVNGTRWVAILTGEDFGYPIFDEIYNITTIDDIVDQTYTVNTNGVPTPLAWTTASAFRPGCGGRSETVESGSNACGGVQGAVILFY
jgi:hypothetical protein